MRAGRESTSLGSESHHGDDFCGTYNALSRTASDNRLDIGIAPLESRLANSGPRSHAPSQTFRISAVYLTLSSF